MAKDALLIHLLILLLAKLLLLVLMSKLVSTCFEVTRGRRGN